MEKLKNQEGRIKGRYWVGILYPENMVENWQDKIGDLLQLPFCYCVHNKDLLSDGDETRKIHVHCIIVFSNTTTRANADRVFQRLSADGKNCLGGHCDQIINIKNKYKYLIHDTETAKKQGKYQYDSACRITGNNFDIGLYESLSSADRKEIRRDIKRIIDERNITNYYDLYDFISENMDSNYEEVCADHSGFFERLTKGKYQKMCIAAKYK